MRDFTIWTELDTGALVEIGDGVGAIPQVGDALRVTFDDIGTALLVVHRRILDGATSQWHVYTRRTDAPMPDHSWTVHRPRYTRDVLVEVPDRTDGP